MFGISNRGGLMKRPLILTLILLIVMSSQTVAQNQSTELEKLGDKLELIVKAQRPGWKHKRGEPMLNATNVLIDYWSFSNRVVKVSVLLHNSPEEAREVLQRFLRYNGEKE